jgi:RHS repeat-associated protein
VVAVTDNLGTLLEDSRYMPFACPGSFGGAARSDVGSVTQTDKSFTGQKSLANTGLMDYNARMYSPLLGRFIQPDTIVAGAYFSQSYNRYSYVINNPIMYIDPSGYKPCWAKKVYSCKLSDKQLAELLENPDTSEFALNYISSNNRDYPISYHATLFPANYSGLVAGEITGIISLLFGFSTTPNSISSSISIIKTSDSELLHEALSYLNFALQTKKGFTLAQTEGFDIIGGVRIYGDGEVGNNNGSDITIGPTSTTIKSLSLGPLGISYQMPVTSSISGITNALKINAGDTFNPRMIDISYTRTIQLNKAYYTGTLGIQYVIKPDNVVLVAAVAGLGKIIYGALNFAPEIVSGAGWCYQGGC